MKNFLKILVSILVFYLGNCANPGITKVNRCGNGLNEINGLCWQLHTKLGNYSQANQFCTQQSFRLPTGPELQNLCRANGGLRNHTTRPGQISTEYWTQTPDKQSPRTNRFTITPKCRATSSVFLNNKYFFCVKNLVINSTGAE